MKQKKPFWGILYGVILTVFTAYVLLDTFLIPHSYMTVEADAGQDIPEDAVITETTYRDDNISIDISIHREYDTNIYVADIRLSSAEYLKTAFAKNTYGKNVTQKTSEIAESHKAILAVNGDFYGAREEGYVARNGMLYRSTPGTEQHDLVIYKDGSFSIITESEISAEELMTSDVAQIFSFGPDILVNGVISTEHIERRGELKKTHPRSAIGIIDELHYVILSTDGRTEDSRGMTLQELASFMQSLGVKEGYNLDGGGSSTLWFNGKVLNSPSFQGETIEERSVSDIVYIGY